MAEETGKKIRDELKKEAVPTETFSPEISSMRIEKCGTNGVKNGV